MPRTWFATLARVSAFVIPSLTWLCTSSRRSAISPAMRCNDVSTASSFDRAFVRFLRYWSL